LGEADESINMGAADQLEVSAAATRRRRSDVRGSQRCSVEMGRGRERGWPITRSRGGEERVKLIKTGEVIELAHVSGPTWRCHDRGGFANRATPSAR